MNFYKFTNWFIRSKTSNQKKFRKKEELKKDLEKKELENCTFKPKTNIKGVVTQPKNDYYIGLLHHRSPKKVIFFYYAK